MPRSIESDRMPAKGQQQFGEFVERTRIKSAFPVVSEPDDTTKENVQHESRGLGFGGSCLGVENSGMSHRVLR